MHHTQLSLLLQFLFQKECVIEIKTFFFNDSIDRYLIIVPLNKSVDSFYLDYIKYFFFLLLSLVKNLTT